VARGFESKDVEFQQAEAERSSTKRRVQTTAEREMEAKRRSVELALSRVRAERDAATNPRHRQMLDQAIETLEALIAKGKNR
jgi:hypothetical protein